MEYNLDAFEQTNNSKLDLVVLLFLETNFSIFYRKNEINSPYRSGVLMKCFPVLKDYANIISSYVDMFNTTTTGIDNIIGWCNMFYGELDYTETYEDELFTETVEKVLEIQKKNEELVDIIRMFNSDTLSPLQKSIIDTHFKL